MTLSASLGARWLVVLRARKYLLNIINTTSVFHVSGAIS